MNRDGWKQVCVEYGPAFFKVWIPENGDVLGMKNIPALKNPRSHIESALNRPAAGPGLDTIIKSLKKAARDIQVAIAVSDNTRPVPYNGEREDGILLPLLKRLQSIGIEKRNIKIIVATGTHAATSEKWKREAFGESIRKRYEIVEHDSSSNELLHVATVDGMSVKINRHFMNADLRIVTGLVEPHFMAGFSGGRKMVCPGLINSEATHLFHSALYMDDPHATNLNMEDNPCHEFALNVARTTGVHFSINVALNSEMQLAGVWAGELEAAHNAAVQTVRGWVEIEAIHEYDIVLTHGGKVAINHYQAVKAAYSVIPLLRRGGVAVLVAHNGDEEPIGKENYRHVLQVLKEKGPGSFSDMLRRRRWKFTPDQWEVQKLNQFFQKAGSFDSLIYCTTNIEPDELKKLPGRSGYDIAGSDCSDIAAMVQHAIDHAVASSDVHEPRFAYVKDGPYVVPVLRDNATSEGKATRPSS
jgi:nickel-dependent lactate racemase